MGLGSFSASYQGAFFDSDYGVFYPSKLKIEFESSGEINSNLLRESLKRKFNLKGSEAEKLIIEFVKSINSKLRQNHYCRLEGIGYLIEHRGKICLKDTAWKERQLNIISPLQVS